MEKTDFIHPTNIIQLKENGLKLIKDNSSLIMESVICPNSSMQVKTFELISPSKIFSIHEEFNHLKLVIYWKNHLPKIVSVSRFDSIETTKNTIRAGCFQFSLVAIIDLEKQIYYALNLIDYNLIICKKNSINLHDCKFDERYARTYDIKPLFLNCVREIKPKFNIFKANGLF